MEALALFCFLFVLLFSIWLYILILFVLSTPYKNT